MTDPIDIEVGKRIRQLRKDRGITQTQLGNAIGLTFQQVQKYEKARNRISASKLAQIAKIFQVNVAELFGTPMKPASNIETDATDATILHAYISEMPDDVRRHFKDLLGAIIENQPKISLPDKSASPLPFST
ncbi:MAG: helix-turn-helix domain-containing protein [Kordiimonadaceae bacterium]|nr:helix-turn-helix domain-containing protein [Kordiimonadaceae bacterium]